MSQADVDGLVVDWLNGLTDAQVWALSCQIGIPAYMTYPASKLRTRLGERKNFAKAKKVYEENYA